MLCGFRERGIQPALMLFADTGGELPHTYEHVAYMSDKSMEWFGIPIETVRQTRNGKAYTLEEHSLKTGRLPALAYSRHTCAFQFKVQPQQRLVKRWARKKRILAYRRAIGFDFGEPQRAKYDAKPILKRLTEHPYYPLQEWRWDRKACIQALQRHGIPSPGKSSCFFCPARKLAEIREIKANHTELYERALAIEDGVTKGIKGLQFGISWRDLVAADEAQLRLFEWAEEHASPQRPCNCHE
jgi:hypothetical protein